MTMPSPNLRRAVSIGVGAVRLEGLLDVPAGAHGIVLFAHGSGSSRLSPRNTYVADRLRDSGFATVLFDLLTAGEERIDAATGHLRFDIPLLTKRLLAVTGWAQAERQLLHLPVGYFGASTGAAAALTAAARMPSVGAVVSRGGRPDLTGLVLAEVHSPTLLIVGGNDLEVLELNRQALGRLRCEAQLEVVPGATHLFEEPGALETVADLAAEWFVRHLDSKSRSNALARTTYRKAT